MSDQGRTRPPESRMSRRSERDGLVYYLRVFEVASGKLLGHLADISAGGIKLVSREKLELHRTFELKLVLPKEISGKSEIVVTARSCWVEHDSNPDFMVTGFSFPALNEELEELIGAVHEEFGRETTLSPVTSERPACKLTGGSGR